jgi:hypothetical protein
MRARASSSVPSLALLAVLASPGLACSGANPDVFPDPDVHEAAPPPSEINGEAGSFFDGSLIQEAAAAICDPQSVAGFKPAWTAPEAWKPSACTATQISGFYAACLTPPISTSACKAFVAHNGTCSACLQTEDTTPAAGAIVWHEHDAYWTVNVAGCIARATGDPSGSGCGASYAAAIACRQQSCNACWAGQGATTTFAEFSACEQQAGQSTCLSFAQAVPAACGDLSQGPGSVCMPPSGATAQDAYMQIAPLFCGP